MAETTIAHPAHETTTRIESGRDLYAEHADEIRYETKPGVWLVPSRSEGTSVYEVTLGRRGEFCECADFEIRHPEGGCKHIVAATIARAKSAPCVGCGQRFRHRNLYEVREDHESLTFFEGDRVCEGCAQAHGGIS